MTDLVAEYLKKRNAAVADRPNPLRTIRRQRSPRHRIGNRSETTSRGMRSPRRRGANFLRRP